MSGVLNIILNQIAKENQDIIDDDSRHYKEVDMVQKATELGLADAASRYQNFKAIVPLKHPVGGMKVRIDGRTFVNYVQFESGIAVPNHVAEHSELPYRVYGAKDSMILNCT